MKYIISGTNRPDSNSLKFSKILQRMYKEQGEEVGIIDLREVDLHEISGHYREGHPQRLKDAVAKVDAADGLIMVVPEYNGSFPGALKYFIDHWTYPKSFEYRPVAFVGLGWTFGGLRPVEQLQGVFGYRNSFMYPERVFMMNAPKIVTDETVTDPATLKLLQSQTKGFSAFCKALSDSRLSANTRSN